MPTVAELKAALKAKGIKGYSGKNKTELEIMLAKGREPYGADLLEAATSKLKAVLEPPKRAPVPAAEAPRKDVAAIAKAAKPIAPHSTPVAVTASATAPVRKIPLYGSLQRQFEAIQENLDRIEKATKEGKTSREDLMAMIAENDVYIKEFEERERSIKKAKKHDEVVRQHYEKVMEEEKKAEAEAKAKKEKAEAEAKAKKEKAEAEAKAKKEKAEAKAKEPAAEAAPAKAKTVVAPYIKSLEVGDMITYGKSSHYMGDGGDSRDSAYSVTRPITKVLPRGEFMVKDRYEGNADNKFKVTPSGLWLKDTKNYFEVYGVGGQNLTAAIRDKNRDMDWEVRQTKRIARAEKQEAKEEADWTKSTAGTLRATIEKFFYDKGQRMSNISTAKKDKLIEIIRKYKILE